MDLVAARATLAAMPTVRLGHFPTPLEPMGVLADAGWPHPAYIKRDDCTGLAFGGNKTRKLEYAIGHAKAEGAEVLVTASSVQSNHIRQTAAAAALVGMRLDAIVAPAHRTYGAAYLENGNALLDRLFGARLIPVDSEDDLEPAVSEHCAVLDRRGERHSVIPLGASDGVGSMGYVRCAWELLDQIADSGADCSHIFLPTGSAGTQAGLLAGLRMAGSDMRVIGISVSDPAEVKKSAVRNILGQLAERFGPSLPALDEDDIVVHDRFAGAGYACPTPEADRWVLQAARSDGLLLDPVYTGKAMAGMAELLASGELGRVGVPVFLHTGGAPVLFAETGFISRAGLQPDPLATLRPRIGDAVGDCQRFGS